MLEDPRVVKAKKMVGQLIEKIKQKDIEQLDKSIDNLVTKQKTKSQILISENSKEESEDDAIEESQRSVDQEFFAKAQKEHQEAKINGESKKKKKKKKKESQTLDYQASPIGKKVQLDLPNVDTFQSTSFQSKSVSKVHNRALASKNQNPMPKIALQNGGLELNNNDFQKFPSITKNIKFEPNNLRELDQNLTRKNQMQKQMSFQTNFSGYARNSSHNNKIKMRSQNNKQKKSDHKSNLSYNVTPKLDSYQEDFTQDIQNRNMQKNYENRKINNVNQSQIQDFSPNQSFLQSSHNFNKQNEPLFSTVLNQSNFQNEQNSSFASNDFNLRNQNHFSLQQKNVPKLNNLGNIAQATIFNKKY